MTKETEDMAVNTATCGSKTYILLIATQFLGAFNDNVFKTVVSLLVLTKLTSDSGGILYLSLTAALFFLPYIFFSALAGYLADKYSKSGIVKATKALEVVVMSIALISFNANSTTGLLISVFLMGMQSALFSPAKYGILPEMLKIKELSKANGFLEFSTFIAIIFGTAVAGFITSNKELNPGYITLGIAFLGFITSFGVNKLPAAGSDKPFQINPFSSNIKTLKIIKQSTPLWLSVLGIAFFWSFGALFQLNILLFSKQQLALSDLQTSLLLATLGLGIGVGSIFAGRASEGKVELGLVPIGSLFLVICNILLSIVSGYLPLVYLTVLFLGLGAGFFIVPVQTYLQEFSPKEVRGSYIAASNFFSFLSMLLITFFFWLTTDYLQFTPGFLFFLMGILTIGVTIYLMRLMPEALTRCVNWLSIHAFYRIKTHGRENIPETGGALIVANHVTNVDAMLLLASLPRAVRFIMYRPIYNSPVINPIAKIMKVIPISPEDGRESIEATLKYAADLIKQGELVGIFGEGALTRTGEMKEFRTGMETIMSHVDAPIIPVYLKGLWGSIFSHEGGKVFWKMPKKIPYPVEVFFGEPMSGKSSAKEVEAVVRKLGGEGISI